LYAFLFWNRSRYGKASHYFKYHVQIVCDYYSDVRTKNVLSLKRTDGRTSTRNILKGSLKLTHHNHRMFFSRTRTTPRSGVGLSLTRWTSGGRKRVLCQVICTCKWSTDYPTQIWVLRKHDVIRGNILRPSLCTELYRKKWAQ
jgi:hypothetical protein